MRTRTAFAAMTALCVALAACGTDDPVEPTADEPSADQPAEDPAESDDPETDDPTEPDDAADEATEAEDDAATQAATGELGIASSEFGEVLVDDSGMSLYLFDPDEQGESTCYEDCAEAWPPLEGPVEAADGVDPSLLGTTERTDGTIQATYNSWPLYLFAGDTTAGDTAGQGVQDVWWLVSPEGERLELEDEQGESARSY